MDNKRFILAFAIIAGLTIVAITFFQCVAKVQVERYRQKNFEPLCSHRPGSFTIPRHLHPPFNHQQHYYRHHNRYDRPLPVKTYFKYIPPPPRRHKIKRRRRTRGVC